MVVRFFEDGFNYKKYMDEQLLKVENLEERSEIRKAIEEMMIPFYEHIEESYKQIEEKLFVAKNENQGRFQLITAIEERDRIDITDNGMFPMRMQDMDEQEILVEDLLNAVKQENEYKIYSVFIQADYQQIRKLELTKRTFRAVIKTSFGEYPASVCLRKNTEYIDMVKELYQEFQNNGIEWKTVCAPYLHKIFDVNMISAECPQNEKIKEIIVFFEEYEPYVKYHYVPLWNIRKISVTTSVYPNFCLDRIHYEHNIFGTKLKPENDYLVAGKRHIWNVSRRNGDLYIQCDEKESLEWTLKEFSYEERTRYYELPLMKNEKSVSRRYIRTIAEAKRYVEELDCGAYIELKDVNQNPHNQQDETYDCDAFMIDEIRKSEHAPKLYFEFESSNKESILTRDIMSYAVSKLQLIYPEYQCKGVLI